MKKKYPDLLIKQRTWKSNLTPFLFFFLCLISVVAVAYITVVDTRYLLTHISQLNVPGLTEERRIHLELEVAAEAVKVFLDIYLLGVVLLIITPSLYTFFSKKDFFGIADGLELAAKMFFSRVEDLTKWLIGVMLLRLVIRLFQNILRLEFSGEVDIVYVSIVILLVLIALLVSRRQGRA